MRKQAGSGGKQNMPWRGGVQAGSGQSVVVTPVYGANDGCIDASVLKKQQCVGNCGYHA